MPKSTVSAAATGLPLSTLIRDPFVRRAFERTERDPGDACAVSPPRRPVLSGGAVAALLSERDLASLFGVGDAHVGVNRVVEAIKDMEAAYV